MDFAANFIALPAVQKFWKSVNIWESYTQLKGGNFFETQETQCRTMIDRMGNADVWLGHVSRQESLLHYINDGGMKRNATRCWKRLHLLSDLMENRSYTVVEW